jgi:hypothetical protein
MTRELRSVSFVCGFIFSVLFAFSCLDKRRNSVLRHFCNLIDTARVARMFLGGPHDPGRPPFYLFCNPFQAPITPFERHWEIRENVPGWPVCWGPPSNVLETVAVSLRGSYGSLQERLRNIWERSFIYQSFINTFINPVQFCTFLITDTQRPVSLYIYLLYLLFPVCMLWLFPVWLFFLFFTFLLSLSCLIVGTFWFLS